MNHKKISIIILALVSFLFISFNENSANAAKWHKGNPPVVIAHKWITDYKAVTSNKKDPKEAYVRNYVRELDKKEGFFSFELLYDKDKNLITNWNDTEPFYYPYYTKLGNGFYKEVGAKFNMGRKPSNHELNDKAKHGPYLLFKIYDSNTISEWRYDKKSNGKLVKHYNGKFHATDFIPFS